MELKIKVGYAVKRLGFWFVKDLKSQTTFHVFFFHSKTFHCHTFYSEPEFFPTETPCRCRNSPSAVIFFSLTEVVMDFCCKQLLNVFMAKALVNTTHVYTFLSSVQRCGGD
ncbi:hypothetical protein P8452_51005 [Trifolium repens]|nr:hypothetical protein P8452_51005 [Trifolium repens]